MKKAILSVCLFASTLLSAQSNPIETFYNNYLWFSLAPHDSIIIDFTDSTGAYVPDLLQTIEFERKGVIKSANIYDANGTQIRAIISDSLVSRLRLYDTDINGGATTDTTQIIDFYPDAQDRDTLIEVFADNNGTLELMERYRNQFTGTLLSKTELFQPQGGSLTKVGQSEYFNSNGKLDSSDVAITINNVNIVFRKTRNTYGPFLHSFFTVLESDNPGSTAYEKQEETTFLHDNDNDIVEAINRSFDMNGTSRFSVRAKYLRRNGSDVSIAESEKKATINVFPNPAGETLQLEGVQQFEYVLWDATGEVKLQGTQLGNKLLLDGLPTGSYTISITTEKGQTTVKQFVKY